MSLDTFADVVERDRRMDMSEKNARARIESLFVSYHALIRRNGMEWLLKNKQKVCMGQVLSAIQPKSPRERLESDLAFAHYECKKDFKTFMNQTVKLSDSFQLVNTGPKHGKKFKANRSSGGSRRGDSQDNLPPFRKFGSKTSSPNGSKPRRRLPDCL